MTRARKPADRGSTRSPLAWHPSDKPIPDWLQREVDTRVLMECGVLRAEAERMVLAYEFHVSKHVQANTLRQQGFVVDD